MFSEYSVHLSAQDKHNWVPDLTEQEAEWLTRLPFTLRLRDSVCVVHAGLVPGVAVSVSAVHNSLTHQVVVVESRQETGHVNVCAQRHSPHRCTRRGPQAAPSRGSTASSSGAGSHTGVAEAVSVRLASGVKRKKQELEDLYTVRLL